MRSSTPTLRAGLVLGVGLSLAAALLLVPDATDAQPTGPATFCDAYPSIPACTEGVAECSTCHINPPELNVYGADVSGVLAVGAVRPLASDAFDAALGPALAAVEGRDSDGDGYSNLEELEAGSSPADERSTPDPEDCVDEGADAWNTCGYDAAFAFKKVHIDFCGRSPNLAAREAFAGASDPIRALHDALDACLDSEYWRGIDGRVWNLANRKIGPLQAIKSGIEAGPIPLADYDDDYAYWVYTQTDGHDVRMMLTGSDLVRATRDRDGISQYEVLNRTPDQDYDLRGYDQYQAVRKAKRAGLLTHRWFLMSNTMFTAIPRTTAAQAYRVFLGYDISRLEGLQPVDNEPMDYDSKGVQAEACAVCHSTLDPLAYPFSRYNGIGDAYGFSNQYEYWDDRMEGFVLSDGPGVLDTPEEGVLFGQPVADVVEWGEVATQSEAFRRSRVLDYWSMLLRERPRPKEAAAFQALVDGLADHWSIEAMLHDLVDTEAYGAP